MMSGYGAPKRCTLTEGNCWLTMGYFLTSQPENAVPGKSWVPPKTHTPGSRLEKRGHRYYFPGVGRWQSRDPIKEYGGLNLYGALGNAPLFRWDRLGLKITHNQCLQARRYFILFNQTWRDKAQEWDRQPGAKRCHLTMECACCDPNMGGEGAPDTSETRYREYKVTICENNATEASVYVTMAHEMIHYFAYCQNWDDQFDCSKESDPTKQPFYDCLCAKTLCKEVQAFRQTGECTDDDSCYERLRQGGYLGTAFCGGNPPYATKTTKAAVLQYLKRCKDVPLPSAPRFPQPTPTLPDEVPK
jgi:RHS repeat-associated protein